LEGIIHLLYGNGPWGGNVSKDRPNIYTTRREGEEEWIMDGVVVVDDDDADDDVVEEWERTDVWSSDDEVENKRQLFCGSKGIEGNEVKQ